MDAHKPTVQATQGDARSVLVWDRFVRVFHWTLVISMTTAYVSTDKITWVHKGAGYLALALVLARIVWGLVASNPYARFSQFVPGPRTLWQYVSRLVRGQEPRFLGHNPAGAVMILYLLVSVLVVSITGWLMTTDAYWGNELVENLHVVTVDVMLWAVLLHVAANVLAYVRHGDNLIAAMFTGRKNMHAPGHAAGAQPVGTPLDKPAPPRGMG